ncbi:unnamed protein product, partial [Prorocentrum cordatum]
MAPRPFSWCTCGNWTYNFRLLHNGGMCGKCGAQVALFQPDAAAAKGKGKGKKGMLGNKGGKGEAKSAWNNTGGGKGPYPWSKEPDVSQMLAILSNVPALAAHADVFRQADTSFKASKAKPVSPNQEVYRCSQTLEKKEMALQKASADVVKLESALQEAKLWLHQTAEEALSAKRAHNFAVKALADSTGAAKTQDGYTADGKKIYLALDEFDFAASDEFDDTQKAQLQAIQTQVEEHCKQVADLQKTMQEALKSVKEIRAAPAKRQRGQDGAVPGPGAAEAEGPDEDQAPAAAEDGPSFAVSESDIAAKIASAREATLANMGDFPPLGTGNGCATAQPPLPQYAASSDTRAPVPENYDATYFFSNISEWGPQAEGFMQAQAEQYDVIGFAEMHLRGVKILDFTEKISKDGWKATATAAVPSGRSTAGTTGGEAIISKRSLATTSFEGWRKHEIERSAVDPFQGFCPTTWHTKAGNIVVISAYMQPKHGMKGVNEKMMIRLASFINMISDPWVGLADWNNPPEAWAGTKWLRKIGGQLFLPENTKTTCNLGCGSLIDYGICKSGSGGSLKLEAVPEVPWKTHVGLLLSIRAGKQHWWHRAMRIPKQLPTAGRKVKKADPNSKRQKSIVERRQRAKARLQEELQDAYEEPHSWPTTADTDSNDSVTFDIPLEVRRAAAVTVAGLGEDNEVRKKCADSNTSPSSHFLLTRDPEAQEQVARAFGDWVQTVEKATLKHHDIPETDWKQYEGRASEYKITWRRARAAPARAHMRDPMLEWWHLATTIIARYQLMRRKFAEQDYVRMANMMKELLDAATENNFLAKYAGPDDKRVLDDWTKAIADLNGQHIDALQGLLEIGLRFQARAVGIGLANGRRAFASWVTRMWKQAPGALHRHVKPAATRRDEHCGDEGSTYATPCEIMDRRADYWENVWSDSSADPKSILDGLKYVAEQAKREDVHPLELEHLDHLLAKQNPKKSRGIDNLGPLEVQRLLEPGRRQMLEVLNLCEKHLMWPYQLYTVI